MTMIWVFLDSNHLYSRMKMIGGCERFKSGQSGASEQNIETEKTAGSIYGFACLIGPIRFYWEKLRIHNRQFR